MLIIFCIIGALFIFPIALLSIFFLIKKNNIIHMSNIVTPMINKFFNELYNNRNTNNDMSIDEALEILGLEGKINNEQINIAYHKLMKSVHPDKGGSAYFAQKLNQARDKLLKSHH